MKIARIKRKKHNKVGLLARSKLNSFETAISPALIDHEVNHEDLMAIVKREKKLSWNKTEYENDVKSKKWYWKNNLIEEGKRISVDEIIKRNEIIKNK